MRKQQQQAWLLLLVGICILCLVRTTQAQQKAYQYISLGGLDDSSYTGKCMEAAIEYVNTTILPKHVVIANFTIFDTMGNISKAQQYATQLYDMGVLGIIGPW